MSLVLNSESRWWAPSASAPAVKTEIDPSDYREFVFRCALAVCGEPDGAQDVAQEVLLTLMKNHQKLANTDHPMAWVRKVTVRCALHHLSSSNRMEIGQRDEGPTESITDNLAVYEVLSQLKPEQRAILGMALGQGLSYREIAEALDIPEGTVGSRLNLAKKEFQKRWQP